MTELQAKTLNALLAWYEAMGVDEAIGDEPVNRFATATAPPETLRRPRPSAEAPAAKIAAASAKPAAAASAVPAEALSLRDLEVMVSASEDCGLKRTAKSLCFARGNEAARLMLIGEAPGRDEDLQGKPFVGRAGQLLDRMLAAIGLDESHVYITNTVYWRPPGNRTPTPQEVTACAPFLCRQIELLNPAVLVLLGGAAAKNILGVGEGIMRLRGKWLTYSCAGREIPTLATLHPAYLLRKPEEKRYAWRDLLMLKEAMEKL